MKKLAVLALAGAFAVPSVAVAEDPAPAPKNAAKACKAQRTAIGVQAFKDLYGTNKTKSNAFGKCVSKQEKLVAAEVEEAKDNAPAKCREERAADPAAFAAKYGTHEGGKNAFGKCVSQTAKADAAAEVEDANDDTVNAAKACKAERKADPDAFKQKYGTNENKRNAFGKCVSQTKKALEDDEDEQQESQS